MTHTNITSVEINGRELPIIDGCVTYTVMPEPQDEQAEEGNTPMGMDAQNDEEADCIHICRIDDEIARLQALKRLAANYFVQGAIVEVPGLRW